MRHCSGGDFGLGTGTGAPGRPCHPSTGPCSCPPPSSSGPLPRSGAPNTSTTYGKGNTPPPHPLGFGGQAMPPAPGGGGWRGPPSGCMMPQPGKGAHPATSQPKWGGSTGYGYGGGKGSRPLAVDMPALRDPSELDQFVPPSPPQQEHHHDGGLSEPPQSYGQAPMSQQDYGQPPLPQPGHGQPPLPQYDYGQPQGPQQTSGQPVRQEQPPLSQQNHEQPPLPQQGFGQPPLPQHQPQQHYQASPQSPAFDSPQQQQLAQPPLQQPAHSPLPQQNCQPPIPQQHCQPPFPQQPAQPAMPQQPAQPPIPQQPAQPPIPQQHCQSPIPQQHYQPPLPQSSPQQHQNPPPNQPQQPQQQQNTTSAGAQHVHPMGSAMKHHGEAPQGTGRRRVTITAQDKDKDSSSDDEDKREFARRRSRWGSMVQHIENGKNVIDLTSKRQSRFQMIWRDESKESDEEDEVWSNRNSEFTSR